MSLSILVSGLVEGTGWTARKIRRLEYTARARARARALARPLVTVGAPTAGFTGGYPCGDLCVDLQGCRACGAPPRDLTKRYGIPVADASVVVFVSYVLEYVDDLEAAWDEIVRAAGSPDAIFVAHVQPWSRLTSLFYPGARYIIERAPPEHRELVYRRVRRDPYVPAFAKR
jgi:hypothetical protein